MYRPEINQPWSLFAWGKKELLHTFLEEIEIFFWPLIILIFLLWYVLLIPKQLLCILYHKECLGPSTSAFFLPLNLGQALAAEVEWCLPWIGHICPPQTSTLASTAHKSASQYWQLAALLRRRRKVQILFPALLSFSRALIGDKATDWRTQPLHNLRFARNCQLHKERDYEIHPFLFECMICSKTSVPYFCHQVTTLLLPL